MRQMRDFSLLYSKHVKKAFTLIELVFVIVLIGIISAVAITAVPNTRALSDAKFIKSQIMQTRFTAMGDYRLDQSTAFQADKCIIINAANLDQNSTTSGGKPYQLGQNTVINTNVPNPPTLCFDWMGRPYVNNLNRINRLDVLGQNADINVTAQGRSVLISVYPYSGYVTINQ